MARNRKCVVPTSRHIKSISKQKISLARWNVKYIIKKIFKWLIFKYFKEVSSVFFLKMVNRKEKQTSTLPFLSNNVTG
jgi:hypothetical protein